MADKRAVVGRGGGEWRGEGKKGEGCMRQVRMRQGSWCRCVILDVHSKLARLPVCCLGKSGGINGGGRGVRHGRGEAGMKKARQWSKQKGHQKSTRVLATPVTPSTQQGCWCVAWEKVEG